MMTVYRKQGNAIIADKLGPEDPIPYDLVWIDMHNLSVLDLERVREQLHIQLPTYQEVWKNHTLNRLYMEDGVAYLTASLISKQESPYPETSAITFILTPDFLLTARDISPTSFRNFAARLQQHPESFRNSTYVLEGLMEEIIARVAHNSEVLEEKLDQLSHRIFGKDIMSHSNSNPSQLMREVLTSMGTCADLNSKINESLHSINRLLTYLKQNVPSAKPLEADIDMMIADTLVLSRQTDFDADKIAFQLDATLGMINVEQNVIIKMFSVMAVFFMPPTLVASVYGMNFHHMPELDWTFGYPLAISIMVLFAVGPYLYFRKKGWL